MSGNGDRLVITNGKLILDDAIVVGKDIVIERGAIKEIADRADARRGRVINANGNFVAPGFIDVHTHGSFGIDLVRATPEEIAYLQKRLPETGVTSFLATAAGIRQTAIRSTVQSLQDARKRTAPAGAQILGVHIEGPYLNPARSGAIPKELLEPFDPSRCDFLDTIEPPATMTLAPELVNALALIDELTRRGIVPCGGHSEATFEQTVDAVNHGLKHITHLFNAMSQLHHRSPNILAAGLALDELTVELIVDDVHVPSPFISLVTKAKGFDRIILVTDATAAASQPDGQYTFGGVKVVVRDGIARTPDGALAGSTLTLNRAVRNFREFTCASMQDDVKTVTSNPARLLGVHNKKGKIHPGMDADITIFDNDLTILATVVAGRTVWQSAPAPHQ
jgi:N-acetylglucosamine-6-phosphate deacetylase